MLVTVSWLLDWATERAWSYQPHRVWLNTGSLDHPKALTVYQQAGFKVYDRKVEQLELAS